MIEFNSVYNRHYEQGWVGVRDQVGFCGWVVHGEVFGFVAIRCGDRLGRRGETNPLEWTFWEIHIVLEKKRGREV